MHIIIPVVTLIVGLGAGWWAKTKYGPKAGAIETKIDEYVKKL